MYSGVKIIGSCKIGSNVVFAANTFIINMDIPSNSIVLGQYPNVKIKPNDKHSVFDFFRQEIK